jgi:hypothetical protein
MKRQKVTDATDGHGSNSGVQTQQKPLIRENPIGVSVGSGTSVHTKSTNWDAATVPPPPADLTEEEKKDLLELIRDMEKSGIGFPEFPPSTQQGGSSGATGAGS